VPVTTAYGSLRYFSIVNTCIQLMCHHMALGRHQCSTVLSAASADNNMACQETLRGMHWCHCHSMASEAQHHVTKNDVTTQLNTGSNVLHNAACCFQCYSCVMQCTTHHASCDDQQATGHRCRPGIVQPWGGFNRGTVMY
jgi:hypothetical protein